MNINKFNITLLVSIMYVNICIGLRYILNYKKEHYTQLLSGYMKNDDDIATLAEMNLRQMDAIL